MSSRPGPLAAVSLLLLPALAFGAAPTPREWRFIASAADIRVTVRDIPRGAKPAHDLFVATLHGRKPLNHLRFTNAPVAVHFLMPTAQPSDGIFLLRKTGEPDERVLVVTSKGVIRDLPAGEVYAIKKLHLLVIVTADQGHPTTSLAVVDLGTGKIELDIKNASRPREYLEPGKRYRLWLSDSELLIEPQDGAAGSSWLRISIDGKQLEHTPPPDADSRSFLTTVSRLRWTRLKAAGN